MELLPNSYETHDAVTKDGRYVQIKTTQGKGVVLGSEPDYLIVLWIDKENGRAYEVYNGKGNKVWAECGKLQKTGTRPISVPKLKTLDKGVDDCERIQAIHIIEKK